MKAFIAFVAFVALGGFAWWEHTRIGELTQELEKLRAPKPVAARVTSNMQKIICPLCHGERVVVIRGESKLQTRTEPCPVCLGYGYRMVKVLPGFKICPDCKGMGIVFYPEVDGQMPRHDNCQRCGATGLVADTK